MIPRPRNGRDPDPAPADPDPDIDHGTGPHPDPDPDTSDPAGGDEEQATAEVMRLLGGHVPLALLADLAERDGPPSPVILEHEGLPEVAWWETGSR